MSGKATLTKAQAEKLFEQTFEESQREAKRTIKNFSSLSINRQTAIVDLIFNMGLSNFNKAPGLVTAMNAGDFDKAIEILKKQPWFKQVKSRAPRVLKLLKDK